MVIYLINQRDGQIYSTWQQKKDSPIVFKEKVIIDIDKMLELFGHKPLTCFLNDLQCELFNYAGKSVFKTKTDIPLYFWNLYLNLYKIQVKEVNTDKPSENTLGSDFY